LNKKNKHSLLTEIYTTFAVTMLDCMIHYRHLCDDF
jgi:hypothetical protein